MTDHGEGLRPEYIEPDEGDLARAEPPHPDDDALDQISDEVHQVAARVKATKTQEILARAAAERRMSKGDTGPILVELWVDLDTAAAIGQTRYGSMGAGRCETPSQLKDMLAAHYIEAGEGAITYSAETWRKRIEQLR